MRLCHSLIVVAALAVAATSPAGAQQSVGMPYAGMTPPPPAMLYDRNDAQANQQEYLAALTSLRRQMIAAEKKAGGSLTPGQVSHFQDRLDQVNQYYGVPRQRSRSAS